MFSNLAYLLRESFRGWSRHRRLLLPTLVTVFLVALVLEGTLAAMLVVHRAMPVPDSSWKLELFLTDEAAAPEARERLLDRVRSFEGVLDVRFVGKEEAAERFVASFGPEALELAGENPLPCSVEIWPREEWRDPFRYRPWTRALASLEGVESASSSAEALERVAEWKSRAEAALGALALLLLLALHVVLGNAVRVSLYARALLIENMKYVGAGEATIVLPLAMESATLSLVGGSVAWGAWELVLFEIRGAFPAWADWFAPLGPWGALVAALAVLASVFAGVRAVRAHLRSGGGE